MVEDVLVAFTSPQPYVQAVRLPSYMIFLTTIWLGTLVNGMNLVS